VPSTTLTHVMFTGVLLILLGMVSVIAYTSTQNSTIRMRREEEKAIALYVMDAVSDLRRAARYAREDSLILRKMTIPGPSRLNVNYNVTFGLEEGGEVVVIVSPRSIEEQSAVPLGGDVVTLDWLSWAVSNGLLDSGEAASIESRVSSSLSDLGVTLVTTVYSSQTVYLWIYKASLSQGGYLMVVGWGVKV